MNEQTMIAIKNLTNIGAQDGGHLEWRNWENYTDSEKKLTQDSAILNDFVGEIMDKFIKIFKSGDCESLELFLKQINPDLIYFDFSSTNEKEKHGACKLGFFPWISKELLKRYIQTPLSYACCMGNAAIVSTILKDKRCKILKGGFQALKNASKYAHTDIVKMLLEHETIEKTSEIHEMHNRALLHAIKYHNWEIVDLILSNKNTLCGGKYIGKKSLGQCMGKYGTVEDLTKLEKCGVGINYDDIFYAAFENENTDMVYHLSKSGRISLSLRDLEIINNLDIEKNDLGERL